VGSMHSKSLFFHCQTAANCVLIKTQPQRKQTASSIPPLMYNYIFIILQPHLILFLN
jgi:hypothetical protein